jgi:hypothetical protein
MELDSEKYKKVLKVLKSSKPELISTEHIANEVIKRISVAKKPILNFSEVMDSLFGWVYIGWVRRSLITASVLLVIVFIYQQGVMFKQINFLSRQIIVTDGGMTTSDDYQVEKMLMTYKKATRGFHSRSLVISEKRMKQLLDSVNDLQIKYRDLIKLYEEDPETKKYIENKLIENSRTKIKL